MQKRFIIIFGILLLSFYLIIIVSAENVGVTNPGKSETQYIDIGQIQTSGKETWTDSLGVTIEIDYDELKQNKDRLRQALDSCLLPTIIDCDARCDGLKSVAGTDCYQDCNGEQYIKTSDYEDCLYELASEGTLWWSIGQVVLQKASHFSDSFCPSTTEIQDETQACEKTCPGSPNSMDPHISDPYYECWLGICRRNQEKQWFNFYRCEVQAYATAAEYFQKWLELVGGGKAVPSSLLVAKPEEEQQNIPKLEDSAALMESVSGKHNEEIKLIKNYYERPQATFPGTTQNEETAKKKIGELHPQGLDLVNAKGDYQDALKKGASKEELAKLKDNYDKKIQEFKNNLQNNVLSEDSGNPDALWQMGTVSKWEGNNKQSYEYYRDSLLAAKSRNPFQYQQLLDSINNPGIRMVLLQSMEPNEKIITLPTTETSPFLKGLKDNLKTLVQPVTEKYREMAENIEKISRAFSISDKINQAKKELGISLVGGKNE